MSSQDTVNYRWVYFALLITVLLLLGFYIWKFHGGVSNNQEIWGQFGDFFGGVLNPIVGFFTIVLLILTVTVQQREASSAKEELNIAHDKKQIDALVAVLELLDQDLPKRTVFMSARGYRLPLKEKRVYKNALLASKDLELLFLNLKRLEKFPDQKPVVDYYKHKYHRPITILYQQNYLSEEIHKYFEDYS